MEWWVILLLIVVGLMFIMLTGIPVAFAFFIMNFVILLIFSGQKALVLLPTGIMQSLSSFLLIAVPLFIFMGEVLFRTGIVNFFIDSVDKWLGRVPGRLSYAAIVSGTVLGALSGSSIGVVAALGSSLIPEMQRRKYSRFMSIGPVLGAGGLDALIPPSAMAVIFAGLTMLSAGKVLMAGMMPGILLAVLYASFILIVSWWKPHLAPLYKLEHFAWTEKLKSLVLLLPIILLIFVVLGIIFFGIATPTESAAVGAVGSLGLAFAYKRVRISSRLLMEIFLKSAQTTSQVFFIVAGSATFGSVLAMTGAGQGLVRAVSGLQLPPNLVIVGMIVVVIIFGTLMDTVSNMMITAPIFIPLGISLGCNPIWLTTMLLAGIELGALTPPFGMAIFVMQAVYPEASYREIIMAGLPYVAMEVLLIFLVMIFPIIALWLPSMMIR